MLTVGPAAPGALTIACGAEELGLLERRPLRVGRVAHSFSCNRNVMTGFDSSSSTATMSKV